MISRMRSTFLCSRMRSTFLLLRTRGIIVVTSGSTGIILTKACPGSESGNCWCDWLLYREMTRPNPVHPMSRRAILTTKETLMSPDPNNSSKLALGHQIRTTEALCLHVMIVCMMLAGL